MVKNTVKQFNIDDLQVFLKEEGKIVLDVLPPEHYADRHIPGAVNACVFEVGFLDSVAAHVDDKNTPILLYGAGEKSMDCLTAAEKLNRVGYDNIAIFQGGLGEWLEKGFSLEGNAPDSLEPPHPLLNLQNKTYTLVPQESSLLWTGRNNNGGHHGTLSLSDGKFTVKDEMSGQFIVDMTSIKCTDLTDTEMKNALETHLSSDDFFFTKLFPEAGFTTTSIKILERGEATRPNCMIMGDLTLRGLTAEMGFPAHIRNIEDGKIAILANLDFDRTNWGIVYGSSRFFQYLSYHVVYDFISVDFRLVLE